MEVLWAKFFGECGNGLGVFVEPVHVTAVNNLSAVCQRVVGDSVDNLLGDSVAEAVLADHVNIDSEFGLSASDFVGTNRVTGLLVENRLLDHVKNTTLNRLDLDLG